MELIFKLILSNLLIKVSAYGTGAPCAAEHNLHPSSVYHGESRNLKQSPPPYYFYVVDQYDADVHTYTPGRMYTVRLASLEGAHFRGFIIQPRVAAPDGSLVGSVTAGHFIFNPHEFGIQYQQCDSMTNASITHTNNSIKFFLETKWTVERYYGPIQFTLTVVQEKNEYWEMWRPESGLLLPRLSTGITPTIVNSKNFDLKNRAEILAKQVLEHHQAPQLNETDSGESEEDGKTFSVEITTAKLGIAGLTTLGEPETSKQQGVLRENGTSTEETSTIIPLENSIQNGSLEITSTTLSQSTSTDQSTQAESQSFFRIPLSSLNRIRDIFKHGGTKIDLESFKSASSPLYTEITSSSTTRPTVNWPAANRIEFPTLGPFPVASTSTEGSGKIEQSNETTLVPESKPEKVQPSLHFLRAAPSASDEEETWDNLRKGQRRTVGPDSLDSDESNESTQPDVLNYNQTASSPVSAGEKNEGILLPAPSAEELASTIRPGQAEGPVAPRLRIQVDGRNETLEELKDASILKEEDFCTSAICYNKGTCVNIPDEGRYRCKCSDGWTGPICDVKDYCGKENPCKNGGNCVNGDSGYNCTCLTLFVGQHCESKCPASLCKNGATCILQENGGYLCVCRPGYTGSRCDVDIDDCANNPCLHNATCVDKVGTYQCQCPDGYMGYRCHRPCQNIYKSCPIWGQEGRCESTRKTTRWFDINCAVSCAQCVFVNNAVKTLIPLPPVLEALSFLIGKWTVTTKHTHKFPIDFLYGKNGYYEEIEFLPTNVPMFGTPSINFTSISINNEFPDDIMISRGLMTLKSNTSPTKVALMTTGNDGITMLEEGVLTDSTTLEMTIIYTASVSAMESKVPTVSKRQFALYSGFLRETVERQVGTEKTEYFTKYFYKEIDYPVY